MPAQKKNKLKKKNPAKKTIRAKKKAALKKSAVKKLSPKKRLPKKKTTKSAPPAAQVEGIVVGKITHYFPHVNAAVVKLKASLKAGDTIRIKGHTSDFRETVTSIQINHVPINDAKKGDEIGLSVASRVRAGDTIYKV